jgi:uncharacterized protein
MCAHFEPKTIDIPCVGYAVKADVYEGHADGAVLLSLMGRKSRRTKPQHHDLLSRLAVDLGITSVIFDYSGHGDSPFKLDTIRQAHHFLEAITAFDWIKAHYPNRHIIVVGSSYGGYLASLLLAHRTFDALILRTPAIYKSSDFYTTYADRDRDSTKVFRSDTQALSTHPLWTEVTPFKGSVLLVVHEHDESIPQATSTAYTAAFKPEVMLMKGISHSLDDATPAQVDEYNQRICDWLRART